MPALESLLNVRGLKPPYLLQFATNYVEVCSLIIINYSCQWEEAVNIQDHNDETSQVERSADGCTVTDLN